MTVGSCKPTVIAFGAFSTHSSCYLSLNSLEINSEVFIINCFLNVNVIECFLGTFIPAYL